MQGPVVGSSSTEKMLPHKRCQSFGQGGLLWLPSIGGIWDLFTCSTGAIEIPKTREKVSHALAIRPLKPTHRLPVDEFVRCGRHEIRVAEPFHDEERLGVSNQPLFRQPRAEALFVVQPLLLDPAVPSRDALPRPFLEESFGHGPHPFPISNVRHRRLSPEMLCRSNDNERQEDCLPSFERGGQHPALPNHGAAPRACRTTQTCAATASTISPSDNPNALKHSRCL